MNMVERVQHLQIDVAIADEHFVKLKDALDEYHRLIKERKLSPKSNNIQDIYTVYAFKSNMDM